MKVVQVLVEANKPFFRWLIWFWMYMRNVAPDQRTCFWIFVYAIICNFIAISPPAWRECTPTSSHEIPLFPRSILLTSALTDVLIWVEVIVDQITLVDT